MPPTLRELVIWMRIDDERAVVSTLAAWPRTDLALRLPLDELSADAERQIRARIPDLDSSRERLAELKGSFAARVT